MRFLRIVGCVLAMVFALPPLYAGAQFLLSYWRARSGTYYTDFDYRSEGLLWLVCGLVALIPILYALLRPQSSSNWLLLGFLVGLIASIALPTRYAVPRYAAHSKVFDKMLNVGTAMTSFGRDQKHFPASDSDLNDALRDLRAGDSPYARNGQRLPFRMIYVKGAKGPVLTPLTGAQPGDLYCAVSSDFRRFWVTAVAPDGNASERIVIFGEPDKPEIIQDTLETEALPEAPPPAPKRRRKAR